MQDLAVSDEVVKETIGKEKTADVYSEFEVLTDIDTKWTAEMNINRWGGYENTPHNVKLILENDPNLKGKFALDEFAHRMVVLDKLVWRKDNNVSDWIDADDSALRNYISDVYGIKGKDIIADAIL